MPKDAILQVRLDTDLKQSAEELYRTMGMSLSEAVRMFVAQSIADNSMPFKPHSTVKQCECKAYGALRLYSNPDLRDSESDVWNGALSAKEVRQLETRERGTDDDR